MIRGPFSFGAWSAVVENMTEGGYGKVYACERGRNIAVIIKLYRMYDCTTRGVPSCLMFLLYHSRQSSPFLRHVLQQRSIPTLSFFHGTTTTDITRQPSQLFGPIYEINTALPLFSCRQTCLLPSSLPLLCSILLVHIHTRTYNLAERWVPAKG